MITTVRSIGRVSTMPTVRGPRAVVRLPVDGAAGTLAELSLPADVRRGLEGFAAADAGLLLVVGPAGSGKTTTLYALLAEIVRRGEGLSVVTLEDPVERRLTGVTQIEVTRQGLTYETALRSMLRQDPQVLMLGEIRDPATAKLAAQAALSGHRLVATLHAADAAGAVGRLREMDVEPHAIRGTLFGVVAQRLVRRRVAEGEKYQGRVPVATFTRTSGDVLRRLVVGEPVGLPTLHDAAAVLVADGVTDGAEVARVLGSANEK